MIVSYRFKNFKSFKDEQTLYMIPVKKLSEDKVLDRNILTINSEHNLVKESGNQILKIAAISGQNASGKSNLIESLIFMKETILNSFEKIDHTGVFYHPSGETGLEGFMYLPAEIPSLFELSFLLNNSYYRYGFELTRDKILSEWLVVNNQGREKIFFKREGDSIVPGNRHNIDPDMIKLGNKILKGRQKSLILSFLIAMGEHGKQGEISDVYTYFKEHLSILDRGVSARDLAYFLTGEEGRKSKLFNYLRSFITALDTRIIDLELSEELDQEYPFISIHETVMRDGSEVVQKIPFSKESAGTRKLLEIAIPILMALAHKNRVLLIDELDSNIHTNLFIEIIKLFQGFDAQLIFVTHNPYILDHNLLRRDQVYFIDKNEYEESELYALSDFKGVRRDDSYLKRYLNGNYGAVPIVDFSMLKEHLNSGSEDGAK